jgi:acyl-CoA thioester hydrolase
MEGPSALGRFSGREHVLPVRVYYEDTDFGGVVYHANYVRYLERGRSEFLRAAGASHSRLLACDNPMTFVVTRMSMDFIRPARIDDLLEVRTSYDTIRGARIINRQVITRDGEILLTADVENVCVSLLGRPRRPAPELMNALSPWLSDARRPDCLRSQGDVWVPMAAE